MAAQFHSTGVKVVDSFVVGVGSPEAEVDHIAVVVEVRRAVVVEVRMAVVEGDRSFVLDILAVVGIPVVHPVAVGANFYRSAWRSSEFLFYALAPISFAPRWQLTAFWPVAALFDKQSQRRAIGILDKSTIVASSDKKHIGKITISECQMRILDSSCLSCCS